MSNKGRLAGKVAVVTGAATEGDGVGNGSATAILFAREGAKVIVVNRNSARGETLAAQIQQDGGEAAAFTGDMTRPDDVAAMLDFTVARYGRLDVVHNNIGIARFGNVETVDVKDWNQVMDSNLMTAFYCARQAIPKMRINGGGSIITVSSIAASGLRRSDGAIAYTTSKFALHGLTLSIAADYATENIRCNCLIVGAVYTPRVAHIGEAGRVKRRMGVPMQVEGEGWDTAHAAVYFASDESRWVTGAFLPVDGGFLAIREWVR